MQLRVGELERCAVFALPQQRRLVGAVLEVPVEAVVADVELAAAEPLRKRLLPVENFFRRREPLDESSLLAPKGLRVRGTNQGDMVMKKILLLAACGAVLCQPAFASTPWQKHHPRRVEVNHRLAHQSRHITEERKEGELSGAQAQALHQQDKAIHSEERADASLNNGHLTPSEQKDLNKQITAVGTAIPK